MSVAWRGFGTFLTSLSNSIDANAPTLDERLAAAFRAEPKAVPSPELKNPMGRTDDVVSR